MKLKNLELKLGDKITFNDGEIVYQDNETWINREHIKKVERYVKHHGCVSDIKTDIVETSIDFYTLKTIYEKKENEPKKIPKQIKKIDYLYEINNHKKVIEPVIDWNFEKIKNKINEIIDKLNEVKDE